MTVPLPPDAQQTADMIRDADSLLAEVSRASARVLEATSAFGRLFSSADDRAEKILARMPDADLYAFAAACFRGAIAAEKLAARRDRGER